MVEVVKCWLPTTWDPTEFSCPCYVKSWACWRVCVSKPSRAGRRMEKRKPLGLSLYLTSRRLSKRPRLREIR